MREVGSSYYHVDPSGAVSTSEAGTQSQPAPLVEERLMSHRFEGTAGHGVAAVRRGFFPLAAALLVAGCTSSPTAVTPSHAAKQTTSTSTASGLPSAGTLSKVASSLGVVQPHDSWGIAADGTSVWVYDGDTGVLKRVTAASGAVAATIQLKPGCATGGGCGNLALGDGAVWVANDVDGTITRVDTPTNAVAATIHMAANASPQVYTTPGAVWSANYRSDSFARIDPKTNTVVATLSHHLSAQAVRYIDGSVWLCDASNMPALTRIDANTGAVLKQIDLTSSGSTTFCVDVAQLGSSLYVATVSGSNPVVVDPATGRTTDTVLPADSTDERGLVGDPGGTWLIDASLGIFRLDTTTGRAAADIALPGVAGIADDGHSVWVITGDGTLYRVVTSGA